MSWRRLQQTRHLALHVGDVRQMYFDEIPDPSACESFISSAEERLRLRSRRSMLSTSFAGRMTVTRTVGGMAISGKGKRTLMQFRGQGRLIKLADHGHSFGAIHRPGSLPGLHPCVSFAAGAMLQAQPGPDISPCRRSPARRRDAGPRPAAFHIVAAIRRRPRLRCDGPRFGPRPNG